MSYVGYLAEAGHRGVESPQSCTPYLPSGHQHPSLLYYDRLSRNARGWRGNCYVIAGAKSRGWGLVRLGGRYIELGRNSREIVVICTSRHQRKICGCELSGQWQAAERIRYNTTVVMEATAESVCAIFTASYCIVTRRDVGN